MDTRVVNGFELVLVGVSRRRHFVLHVKVARVAGGGVGGVSRKCGGIGGITSTCSRGTAV